VTPNDYARARRLLLRRDPVLAALIKKHGACGLAAAQRSDPFAALARAIVGQQLSTKAAATIYSRLVDAMPGDHPTPEGIAALSDDRMRALGLSRQKTAYLRDLAAKVASGDLPLQALPKMDDEDVIVALTKIKGIGRWTAEMFLMFRLHRPDVLPVDDLGIVNAIHRVYKLRKKPNADRIRKLGEAWKPYRSIACWYLWRSLDNEP